MNQVETLIHCKKIERKIETYSPAKLISHPEETKALIAEIEISLNDLTGSELLRNTALS
jgi:hypothetical protein